MTPDSPKMNLDSTDKDGKVHSAIRVYESHIMF